MVKIEKIVLRIGKKELTLSSDEVKELKDSLDQMFGNDKICRYYYNTSPFYQYPYPSITYTASNFGTSWVASSTEGGVALSGKIESPRDKN